MERRGGWREWSKQKDIFAGWEVEEEVQGGQMKPGWKESGVNIRFGGGGQEEQWKK